MSVPTNENLNRRQLLGTGAALGTAMAVVGLTAIPAKAQNAAPAAAPQPAALAANTVATVSSALTVSRLLASFYSQVVAAHNTRAYLTPRALELATAMAADSNANVAALEGALGAGNVPAAQAFTFPVNVFVSPIGFAWLGHTLEEIAIGSHLDALPRLANTNLTGAVASIIASESRHAAILRTLAGFDPSPRYFESPIEPAQVQNLIAPYIVTQ